MLRVQTGGEYTAARVRSGSSERGDWELVVIKGENRARQELTVYPTNMPCGVTEGEKFTLNSITGVQMKKRRDADGNWTKEEVSIMAEIRPLAPNELEDFDSPFSSSDYSDLADKSDFDTLL